MAGTALSLPLPLPYTATVITVLLDHPAPKPSLPPPRNIQPPASTMLVPTKIKTKPEIDPNDPYSAMKIAFDEALDANNDSKVFNTQKSATLQPQQIQSQQIQSQQLQPLQLQQASNPFNKNLSQPPIIPTRSNTVFTHPQPAIAPRTTSTLPKPDTNNNKSNWTTF